MAFDTPFYTWRSPENDFVIVFTQNQRVPGWYPMFTTTWLNKTVKEGMVQLISCCIVFAQWPRIYTDAIVPEMWFKLTRTRVINGGERARKSKGERVRRWNGRKRKVREIASGDIKICVGRGTLSLHIFYLTKALTNRAKPYAKVSYHWVEGSCAVPDPRRRHNDKGKYQNHIFTASN